MVIDIELTLNRFGFGKIAENKFQFLCLPAGRQGYGFPGGTFQTSTLFLLK